MDRLVVKATIQAVTLSAISNTLAQLISCYQDGRPFSIDYTSLGRFMTFSLLSCPPNVLWQSWLEKTFPGYTSASNPGTADSIAQQPAVKAVNEKTASALQTLSEKTLAATTAIAGNETMQDIRRRTSDGMDKVRATARDIDAGAGALDTARRVTGQVASRMDAQTFSTPSGETVEKRVSASVNGEAPGQEKKKQQLNITNTAIKFGLDQTIGAFVNTVLFLAGMPALRGEPWPQIVASVHRDTLPLILAGQKLWPAVSIVSFTLVPLEHRTVFGGLVGVFWGIYLSLLAAGKK